MGSLMFNHVYIALIIYSLCGFLPYMNGHSFLFVCFNLVTDYLCLFLANTSAVFELYTKSYWQSSSELNRNIFSYCLIVSSNRLQERKKNIFIIVSEHSLHCGISYLLLCFSALIPFCWPCDHFQLSCFDAFDDSQPQKTNTAVVVEVCIIIGENITPHLQLRHS